MIAWWQVLLPADHDLRSECALPPGSRQLVRAFARPTAADRWTAFANCTTRRFSLKEIRTSPCAINDARPVGRVNPMLNRRHFDNGAAAVIVRQSSQRLNSEMLLEWRQNI